jgi:chorismate mutase
MASLSVREMVVAANEQALNTAIMENQIQPEKIISVMLQPGNPMRIGDNGPTYRVLYRQ